ncbi:MAG: hypothetical protein JKY15_04520 [Deltaproteobacteria bacterium]|nr:hypothetical protein [Deltaproteobacteria bacterium]
MTLDNDLSVLLAKFQTERHASFKEVLNQALREGLSHWELKKKRPRKHYETPSVDMGGCLTGSLDNVQEVLSLAEGEWHK